MLGVEGGAGIELAALGADSPADHGAALADPRPVEDLGGHAAGQGRPEAAAPITLRRALDALVGLDLQPAARALAAGTGGALGL